MAAKDVPPYGRRAGYVPRRQEDFGGGGAFPEVHVPQYPLSMGLRGGDPETAAAGSSNVLALTVDARGRVAFDAIVRQGENSAKIVYSSHADLVPRIDELDQDAEEEDEDEVEATTARTRAALQVIVDARLSAVQPARVRRPRSRDDPAFVKYRPARQSAAFNSGAKERVVRVEHAQEDPVLPPRHRRRRVPRPAGSSPPVTVMHSPPRPASRKDMANWSIPPSVSDWKNAKGYCIPLDKRVAADGRRMQDVQVSDGFTGLSEALYLAEQKAREAIEMRDKVRGELMMKERQQREQKLREIASRARAEAASNAAPVPPVDAEEDGDQHQQSRRQWDKRMQSERDMVHEELRRQRERERRREAAGGKRSRVTRDRERDVGERIALGMASTGAAGAAGEVTYDERLFNQDMGMGSGFAADDVNNVYSGRLFAAQPALSTLYRPNKRGDSDIYGDADEQLENVAKTNRFKPDKGFSGTAEELADKRKKPAVEFDGPEESSEAYDPFDELDKYMNNVKEGKKD